HPTRSEIAADIRGHALRQADIILIAAGAVGVAGKHDLRVAACQIGGGDQYNVGLSQRMAANVRSYLASRGVPDSAITTQAFGESRPAIDTADGLREPQNRRVEVTFGPGSGW
ncbi:MAG: OmpA family protein, partial [Sphingobacteriales bacterium]